jgi:pimeloyl-ACP methyl ester carboxylesterase
LTDPAGPASFTVPRHGHELSGEVTGEGAPIVLLHGLTATRRYVVHGAKVLERNAWRVFAYDARGHGDSAPAPEPTQYEYADLVADLEAVLDFHDLERVALVGNSMGAATSMAFSLRHPERVAALVQVTPAYAGRPKESALPEWDALADGMEQGGVEGFLAAYEPGADPQFHDSVMLFTRQRLERHRYPRAVADALRVVPRSAAFDGLEPLESLDVPTLVVGSRDEADPGHPLSVAKSYVERLPRAELVVEDEGKSPLAWQGAQLSRAILHFLERQG